jgi:hypothetical protein
MRKKCTKCKTDKPLKDFYITKRTPARETSKTTSYKGECKECAKKRTKEWVEKNREKVNKYQLEQYHLKKKIV